MIDDGRSRAGGERVSLDGGGPELAVVSADALGST